jgi:hypothetical protein
LILVDGLISEASHTIQLLACAVLCASLVFVGCGPTQTNPKAVSVKEDPRIKRAGEGGTSKGDSEKAIP